METENNKKNKIVKTYAEDMAKVIESNEAGVVREIIHEKEEQEMQKENLSPESKRNKMFMLIGIVCIFLALGSIVFIVVFRQQIFSVSVAPQFVPLIFTDKAQFVEVGGLAKDKIAQTVLNEVNATQVKGGGVEGIYLTENKAVLGLRKFLTLIKANIDQTQMQFVDDNFLVGVAKNDTNDLFILLKTRSFSDIFPQMRSWEPKMFSDLHGFFGVPISVDTNYLLTKNFEDGVIANKNARILHDKDGKIVLMYVFVDDTSVLITDTETATSEVILRLASSQIKK